MNLLAISAAAGACCGAGTMVLTRGLWPAPPDLARALQALDAHARAPAGEAFGAETSGRPTARAGRWLAANATRLPVPAPDLRLLGRSTEAFFATKTAFAALGLVLPGALVGLFWVLGAAPPPFVPVLVPLAVAAALFFAPDFVVRSEAAHARAQFRRAVAAYLELVALERAADGGPADSLERAAAVGHGWEFTRIADALRRARLVGVAPWTALAQLADVTGVEDLRDLADIVALAGDDGAAIYDTLAAKAAALRSRTLADAEASANAASERLTLPSVALGLGFVLLVAYPALARVLV